MNKLEIILKACNTAMGEGKDIRAKTRVREFVYARSVFFYLAKKYTDLPLRAIGEYCGGRDHATVLHSCKTYEKLKKYPDFKNLRDSIVFLIPSVVLQEENETTKVERELKYLYSNKKRIEKENELLKNQLSNKSKFTSVRNLLEGIDANTLSELTRYRIIPFLKMKGLSHILEVEK